MLLNIYLDLKAVANCQHISVGPSLWIHLTLLERECKAYYLLDVSDSIFE